MVQRAPPLLIYDSSLPPVMSLTASTLRNGNQHRMVTYQTEGERAVQTWNMWCGLTFQIFPLEAPVKGGSCLATVHHDFLIIPLKQEVSERLRPEPGPGPGVGYILNQDQGQTTIKTRTKSESRQGHILAQVISIYNSFLIGFKKKKKKSCSFGPTHSLQTSR